MCRAFGTDGSSDTRKITIIVKSPATNLHAPVFTGTVGSANIVEDANIGKFLFIRTSCLLLRC